ncbi:MAG: hypothetical protein JWO17_3421, partial [Actinomycetia bacterium]|nr:hypothetical protein [Actinomycetes bacterium]
WASLTGSAELPILLLLFSVMRPLTTSGTFVIVELWVRHKFPSTYKGEAMFTPWLTL